MGALRHRTLRFRLSIQPTVHWVQSLSRKVDIEGQQSNWMVALAGHNVAGRVDIRMGQQVVPLSQMCVEAVAREEVIAVL